MTSTAAFSRRQIVRAAKLKGWTIQPDALQLIEEYLNEKCDNNNNVEDNDTDPLTNLMDLLRPTMMTTTGKTIKKDLLETCLVNTQSSKTDNGKKSKSSRDFAVSLATAVAPTPLIFQNLDYRVISAFAQPQLYFESTKKRFSILQKQRSIFGSPDDKVHMMAQRYEMIHQRVLRHELFRPVDINSKRSMPLKLTPIESLLGLSNDKMSLVLGILVQWDEGCFYLEDPSGQIRVNLNEVVVADSSYVTEHCILLVEGYFHDDVFYAQRLGPPLLELRHDSLSVIQQHVSHENYASPSVQDSGNFVLFSNVHLDQPAVVQQLEGILAKYESSISSSKNNNQIPLFCFMGSFSSDRHGSVRSSLDELVSILLKHVKLSQKAHFVIIPSTRDNVGLVLPFPPLASSHLWSRLSHVHFVSNPCRIYWQGREMVLFRYDLFQLLAKQHLKLPVAANSLNSADEDDNEDNNIDNTWKNPFERVVKTVLDQGHLTPVAGMPVFWNLDHTMSLYPLPDVLVLGGDENLTKGFTMVYGDCQVIHTGSFSQGQYATYEKGDVQNVQKE